VYNLVVVFLISVSVHRYTSKKESCKRDVLLLSCTRLMYWFCCRYLSPLSAAPLVALVGFGLYELGFPSVRFDNRVCIHYYSRTWLMLKL
jgi:hypothetical protein